MRNASGNGDSRNLKRATKRRMKRVSYRKDRDREGTGRENSLYGAAGAASAPPDDGTTRAAFAAFVAAAKRHPKWPVPNSLTDGRRKAMKARIKDAHGIDGFLAVLAKAEASPFICNEMDAWSLDWMLKPTNFQKLADGNYDDRGASSPPAASLKGSAGDPPHCPTCCASAGFTSAITAEASTGRPARVAAASARNHPIPA